MQSWPRLWFLDVSSLPPSLPPSLTHSLPLDPPEFHTFCICSCVLMRIKSVILPGLLGIVCVCWEGFGAQLVVIGPILRIRYHIHILYKCC